MGIWWHLVDNYKLQGRLRGRTYLSQFLLGGVRQKLLCWYRGERSAGGAVEIPKVSKTRLVDGIKPVVHEYIWERDLNEIAKRSAIGGGWYLTPIHNKYQCIAKNFLVKGGIVFIYKCSTLWPIGWMRNRVGFVHKRRFKLGISERLKYHTLNVESIGIQMCYHELADINKRPTIPSDVGKYLKYMWIRWEID